MYLKLTYKLYNRSSVSKLLHLPVIAIDSVKIFKQIKIAVYLILLKSNKQNMIKRFIELVPFAGNFCVL